LRGITFFGAEDVEVAGWCGPVAGAAKTVAGRRDRPVRPVASPAVVFKKLRRLFAVLAGFMIKGLFYPKL